MITLMEFHTVSLHKSSKNTIASAMGWAVADARWRAFFRAEPEMGFEFVWHNLSAGSTNQIIGVPSRSGTVELWLNFTGHARISQRGGAVELPPDSFAVFVVKPSKVRLGEKRHEFILARFATAFLSEHFACCLEDLPPSLSSALCESSPSAVKPLIAPLSDQQRQLVRCLRNLPTERASRRLWYSSRAFELMLAFLTTREAPLSLQPSNKSRERVQRVVAILRSAIASPPTLKELAEQVGTSPFYLSRQFHAETGETIPQFIRKLRMESAVELLRSGASNVGQTATAVGYRSASHFTTTFRQIFGCLPSRIVALSPVQIANILSLHS